MLPQIDKLTRVQCMNLRRSSRCLIVHQPLLQDNVCSLESYERKNFYFDRLPLHSQLCFQPDELMFCTHVISTGSLHAQDIGAACDSYSHLCDALSSASTW